MDEFRGESFPEIFDDYIFTPTFIENLLIEATLTSKKVILTPQQIYYTKRQFKADRDSVREMREDIEDLRIATFRKLDEIVRSRFTEDFSFNDILKLEWFRFMHLKVLHEEAAKLEHILLQLRINDIIEVQDLIDEARLIRKETDLKSDQIKAITMRYRCSSLGRFHQVVSRGRVNLIIRFRARRA